MAQLVRPSTRYLPPSLPSSCSSSTALRPRSPLREEAQKVHLAALLVRQLLSSRQGHLFEYLAGSSQPSRADGSYSGHRYQMMASCRYSKFVLSTAALYPGGALRLYSRGIACTEGCCGSEYLVSTVIHALYHDNTSLIAPWFRMNVSHPCLCGFTSGCVQRRTLSTKRSGKAYWRKSGPEKSSKSARSERLARLILVMHGLCSSRRWKKPRSVNVVAKSAVHTELCMF
jgi:hypothetical protein